MGNSYLQSKYECKLRERLHMRQRHPGTTRSYAVPSSTSGGTLQQTVSATVNICQRNTLLYTHTHSEARKGERGHLCNYFVLFPSTNEKKKKKISSYLSQHLNDYFLPLACKRGHYAIISLLFFLRMH